MSAVAAPNGNHGLLRQVRLTRELTLSPPVEAPPGAILAAVADELRRQRNDVVRVYPDRVEFYDDDPPNFLFEHRGPDRLPINGGIVTADAPDRLRLELWMSPCLYVEPLALTLLILVLPMLPTTKAVLLVILLGLAALHYVGAREAYESRIVDAARRASPS